MEKKFAIMMFLSIVFVCFSGCPYDSKVPMSYKQYAQIDEELLGTWATKDEKTEEPGKMEVYPFNENEYLILLYSVDNNKKKDRYSAFTTVIDGHKFLNIREIEETLKHEYGFAYYTIENDTLILRLVDDKLLKNKYDKPEDLYCAIRALLDDEDLYDEKISMIRVK